MSSGVVTFHLMNSALLTFAVSLFVLLRYQVAVKRGMISREGADLPIAIGARGGGLRAIPALPYAWERRRQVEIALAYLLTTFVCALPLAVAAGLLLDAMRPSQILMSALVYTLACAPMIAASLALSPIRVLAGFAILVLSLNVLHLCSYFLERLLRTGHLNWGQLEPSTFLDLAFSQLWFIGLFWLLTSPRRLRGVAPITFAALALFGLVPLLARRSSVVMGDLDPVFLLLSLPIGWLAWMLVHRIARGYERRWFSDAQLTSWMWWSMLVVNVGLQQASNNHELWIVVTASVLGLLAFAPLNTVLLARLRRPDNRSGAARLLLLRVFGYRARTERLFDRVGARWRLFGPVLMIAAPDVSSRTINPGDYLRWLTGQIDELFVTSASDLQEKINLLDSCADPDGRYRVNAFCCRENAWQATVVELMQHADTVIMDARGLTGSRLGTQFELQRLAQAYPLQRLVLVVDSTTDRGILQAIFGPNLVDVHLVEARRWGTADAAFDALLEASREKAESSTNGHSWLVNDQKQ
jgi:hypothetical protein